MSTAWVTLATNDGYAVGALVLAQSLRAANTQHKLHILYTNGVSAEVREKLQRTFDDSTLVDVLDSNDAANLSLIGRPDLGVTFTKLHCWRLTQYTKAVFLDADTLVINNSDELFDRPELAAAADIGWPDYFNSGVFVFVPSQETYDKLVQFGVEHGTFDGGDQGLLNQFFAGWRDWSSAHRLPFVYNVTSGAIYSYAAAFKKLASEIKIVHFLGARKPWHQFGAQTHASEHLALWQKLYHDKVEESLPAHLARYGSGFPPPRPPLYKDHRRRHKKRHHEKHHEEHHQQHHPQEQHHGHDQGSTHHHEQQQYQPEHAEQHYHDPQPHVHHEKQHLQPSYVEHHEEHYEPSYVEYHHEQHYEQPSHYHEEPYHHHEQQYDNESQPFYDTVETFHHEDNVDHGYHHEDHHNEDKDLQFYEAPSHELHDILQDSWPEKETYVVESGSTDVVLDLNGSSSDESKWERRYEDWDRGAIDYAGKDAFENIQKQIEKALNEE
ncbi:unnamed protein product [Bursaphelenchus okinawaensis]|uniref:glycogenin glucosyltransferase n=1 Tax=Bursaphelenchus okinawaensis TaxID=465554 RepID=A0A811LMS6_9BILA|nr:unnamed protein product [Bursaphelenchus okinawaensis]CAG9125576.1 unnamed protein product [Bursaphelenchus okinawaensis]